MAFRVAYHQRVHEGFQKLLSMRSQKVFFTCKSNPISCTAALKISREKNDFNLWYGQYPSYWYILLPSQYRVRTIQSDFEFGSGPSNQNAGQSGLRWNVPLIFVPSKSDGPDSNSKFSYFRGS